MTFGGSPLESLISGLKSSTNAANAGVGAAQGGVNAVLAQGAKVDSSIGDMRNQAGKVAGQGNAVNATAQQVKDTYAQLGPMAALLGDYGKEMWSQGQSLSTEAKDVFGQAGALLGMDPSATGLAGEFIKYWNSLSPDRYVSRATSDTQSSFQNAQGQAERNLARRGVSPTSGAYGALQRQFANTLATALASAKTRAYQLGLDQQAAQLDKMTNAANVFYNMGNQTEQSALAAQNAAIGAQGKAADVLATQGQGYAQAGSLQSTAGDLFAKAASIYGDIGNLSINYGKLLNDAYGNLASANFSKSNAYRNAVATEVSAVNGGGGGGSGGGGGAGMKVSGSGGDWVKSDSFRDTSQGGSPWASVWTNTKTGQQLSGDGLFNPNK